MSDIAQRLLRTPLGDIVLNWSIFNAAVTALLLGDANAFAVRDFLNAHITANGGAPLSAGEQANIATMQTVYTAMTATQRGEYRSRLDHYSSLLQNNLLVGVVADPVAWWDARMGL